MDPTVRFVLASVSVAADMKKTAAKALSFMPQFLYVQGVPCNQRYIFYKCTNILPSIIIPNLNILPQKFPKIPVNRSKSGEKDRLKVIFWCKTIQNCKKIHKKSIF